MPHAVICRARGKFLTPQFINDTTLEILRMNSSIKYLAGFLVLLTAGCGTKEKYVPVSGVVTLDGQPLANAQVLFEPLAQDKADPPGKPSVGRTDSDGRFVLTSPLGKHTGASIGMHRVRILTSGRREFTQQQIEAARQKLIKQAASAGDSAPKFSDEQVVMHLSESTPEPQNEMLPAKYNASTELTFEVPARGTDEANLSLNLAE